MVSTMAFGFGIADSPLSLGHAPRQSYVATAPFARHLGRPRPSCIKSGGAIGSRRGDPLRTDLYRAAAPIAQRGVSGAGSHQYHRCTSDLDVARGYHGLTNPSPDRWSRIERGA